MGVSQVHALGRNQKLFLKAESTFGTFVKPAGTDAAKVLSSMMKLSIERKNRMDARATRSLQERFSGRRTGEWSLEANVIPSGAAGTAPDLGVAFKAAMGVEQVSGGVSVAYSLSSDQSALGSLSIVRQFNDVLMQAAVGAWVERMTISGSGGGEPRVKFEGGCADVVETGTTTLTSSPSSSTTFTVADPDVIEIDSVLKIGSQDNGGAGFKVTNKVGSTITIEAAVTATSGQAVIPFVPTETTAGAVTPGISGSISLGSSLPITNYEVVLANGIKPIGDEAFQSKVTDVIPGYRDVSGKVTVRARKDLVIHALQRKTFTTRDLQLVLGAGAGKICTLDLNTVELNVDEAFEVPEAEEVQMPLSFVALGTDNELAITFT